MTRTAMDTITTAVLHELGQGETSLAALKYKLCDTGPRFGKHALEEAVLGLYRNRKVTFAETDDDKPFSDDESFMRVAIIGLAGPSKEAPVVVSAGKWVDLDQEEAEAARRRFQQWQASRNPGKGPGGRQ